MRDNPHDRTNSKRQSSDRTTVSRGWRAEYLAQDAAIPDGGRYLLPDRGARVRDRESEDGDELVVLETHPDTAAADYPIGALDGTSVAEVNEDYDAGAPVVEAVYVDEVALTDDARSLEELRTAVDAGAITAYSFPVDRLASVKRDEERDTVDAFDGGELA